MTAWRLEVFDELGSTSDLCAERARAGAAAGLAVLALRQTAGRGSRGRVWQAPAGNLNLSVLLRPARPLAEAGMFSLLTGLAVAEALERFFAPPATLKWPNDVLIGGAKLAGVLIDAAPLAGRLDWLVIGIGMNLRAAPEIAGRRTTSLAAHGVDVAPQPMAEAVLDRLAAWQEAPSAAIIAAWLERGHPPGTALRIQTGGQVLEGAFAGLSPRGELLLRSKDRIDTINTGEVLLGQA
ncbi:biotin--[acetyl-CoA-carboxylase] ligase [Acidocella sp. KAb 2-4]|uniref:biotin--[acetyl-CoA-carboxylase] ligase n=1 Tax=Acidocella sp. KAb 2-4 TaxID=2885158 RepID=UPI001D085C3A|nr:biotin--[acetyl-CoA-carboxylase] ligase [Acidocella sp. KAb 2-4]MCB5943591.1 biotin--[acetyl-CoA-carboxylase] ligase [Acidocella sp. KAb 2-4]